MTDTENYANTIYHVLQIVDDDPYFKENLIIVPVDWAREKRKQKNVVVFYSPLKDKLFIESWEMSRINIGQNRQEYSSYEVIGTSFFSFQFTHFFYFILQIFII